MKTTLLLFFFGLWSTSYASTMSGKSNSPIVASTTCVGAIPIKVMIVDPDRAGAERLGAYLSREGYDYVVVTDPKQALERLSHLKPSALITEVRFGNPLFTGLDLVSRIRASDDFADIPILVYSAQQDETDIVAAYEAGADHVVSKPISNQLIRFRIKATLRRASGAKQIQSSKEKQISVGPITIDPIRYRAWHDDKELSLTPTEFRILILLVRQPGRVFTRKEILAASQDGAVVLERTADVHIKALRQKFVTAGASGMESLIGTRRSVGYYLTDSFGESGTGSLVR